MSETIKPLDTKNCPYCAETIKAEAKICRFCGRDLTTGKLPPVTIQPQKDYGTALVVCILIVVGACILLFLDRKSVV